MNIYASVSTCLKRISSPLFQYSFVQTIVQTSPVSPSPFSPNALTSWLFERGDGKWWLWRLRLVFKCSNLTFEPQDTGSLYKIFVNEQIPSSLVKFENYPRGHSVMVCPLTIQWLFTSSCSSVAVTDWNFKKDVNIDYFPHLNFFILVVHFRNHILHRESAASR